MRSLRFVLLLLCVLAASPSTESGAARGADLGGQPLADGEPAAVAGDPLERYHPPIPAPVPVPLPREVLGAAAATAYGPYADAFQILKDENSCSRFFGGPAHSLEVLNALARRLRAQPMLDKVIGIRMTGEYTNHMNARTGVSYRLFGAATVNSNGPFNKRLPDQVFSGVRVGSFAANTRAARALIILHELGHLLKGADGKWLLPNDGYSQSSSHENTRTVEKHCFSQLKLLR